MPDDLANWIDKIYLPFDDRETISENEWKNMIAVWEGYSTLRFDALKLKTEMLTQGGYGKVFEGKLKGTRTGQKFTKAIKVIELNKNLEASENRNLYKSLLLEMDACEYMMPSGATIQVDGVCIHVNDQKGTVSAYIVMPKAKGDLEKLVQERKKTRETFNKNSPQQWQRNALLSKEEVFNIALTVAKGILYMHNLGYVHRDIKPKNILIEDWLTKPGSISGVYLADYGIARKLDPEGKHTTYLAEGATLQNRFMDPTASSRTLDTAADVYAFGLVLWYLICDNAIPWVLQQNMMTSVILERFNAGTPPGTIPEHPLKLLIEKCWQTDPKKRPIMQEVFHMILALAWEDQSLQSFVRNYSINDLLHFCNLRIQTSETPYAFHYKKFSLLCEHKRMINLSDARHFQYFSDQQLRLIHRTVMEGTFISGITQNEFLIQLSHPDYGSNAETKRCLYIYRHKGNGKGYVGISKPSFKTRDRGHARGDQLFDQHYKTDRSNWEFIIFYATPDDDEYEAKVATVLEPLLTLLLNTYSTRENPIGFNVEPGAKKGYKQYLDDNQ